VRETGPDGWLRVSVGTPDDMAAFRAALTEVLAAERPATRSPRSDRSSRTVGRTEHPEPRPAGLEAT
jgi:hypothetical protein